MSVLVEGMEMPIKCARCKLEKSDPKEGYYCSLLPAMKDWTTHTREKCRLPDCPIIPVPPHGDLIDRDAERLNNEIFKFRAFKSRSDIKEMLDAAPVVIPAESEGE